MNRRTFIAALGGLAAGLVQTHYDVPVAPAP